MKLDSGFRRNDEEGTRHSRARPANLPLAKDGRIKSGHDVAGKREAGFRLSPE
jgi:hypothetical protein